MRNEKHVVIITYRFSHFLFKHFLSQLRVIFRCLKNRLMLFGLNFL